MERTKRKATNRLCVLLLLALGVICAACNGGGISDLWPISSNADDIKSPDFYERMLEKFCQQHFDSLYEDIWGTREYVDNSLTVDSVCPAGEREVNVFGMHDYMGRLGWPKYHREFVANIYETKKHSNEYIITFEKQSKRHISRRTYKESRTKSFHYEE